MPERPREFIPVRIALMTVSDTRTRENDVSGDTLEARVRDAGHLVAERVIVPDDTARIADQLVKWIADPEIDVVISTGGTGLTGRDVTPEAFRSVFEKEIDGFSAIFHRISYDKIGTSTIQSRACAGWPRAPICSRSPVRRARSRMAGTRSSNRSSITGTSPAISSRSCRGWKNTAAGAVSSPDVESGPFAIRGTQGRPPARARPSRRRAVPDPLGAMPHSCQESGLLRRLRHGIDDDGRPRKRPQLVRKLQAAGNRRASALDRVSLVWWRKSAAANPAASTPAMRISTSSITFPLHVRRVGERQSSGS